MRATPMKTVPRAGSRTAMPCSSLVLRSVLFSSVALAIVLAANAPAQADPEITFKKTRLDEKFRSEGAGVGDFNHDGKLDIAYGSVYFAAPDWKMVPVLEAPKEFDPHGYSDAFCNFGTISVCAFVWCNRKNPRGETRT